MVQLVFFKEGKKALTFSYNKDRGYCNFTCDQNSGLPIKINDGEDFAEYIETVLNSEDFEKDFRKTLEKWNEISSYITSNGVSNLTYFNGEVTVDNLN